MKDWFPIPIDEQETIINIDYGEKTIDIYTTRYSIAGRLRKKMGEPDEIDRIDGKISGVGYKRKLSSDDVRAILSVSTVIAGFRKAGK